MVDGAAPVGAVSSTGSARTSSRRRWTSSCYVNHVLYQFDFATICKK